jgi:tetratricopeptide (TPR) repeat protein
MRALNLLDRAIVRDPRYAPALAAAAMCHHMIVLNNWTDDPAANRRSGLLLVRQALQSGADDPMVLAYAGFLLGWFGEDLDAALQLVDRALALNPSYAWGWYYRGWLNIYAGRTERAIEYFETSLRLNPRGNRGLQLFGIGVAHLFARRFEEASEKLRLSLEELPSHIGGYRFLAACYAHMRRFREAGEMIDRLSAITPAVLENVTRFRNPEHRELYLSGLRLALGEQAP